MQDTLTQGNCTLEFHLTSFLIIKILFSQRKYPLKQAPLIDCITERKQINDR